jgi:translocation and assembly module TamB
VLGGAPAASVEAERLANGQLVLRRLDVTGRGLKLQASGGRSLLGAVTFKGEAQLSNLEAAHFGAAGAASIGWQAAQARAGAPWTFTLDAKGERFATGLDELDRLLGSKPHLQAQANWQAGRLAVAKADLDGAALTATAAGVMEASQALNFKVDWSASGPFHAGLWRSPVRPAGPAASPARWPSRGSTSPPRWTRSTRRACR